MSLINKMLQDLDARGSQRGPALQSEIKPVAVPERRLPVRQIAIGSAALVVAMAVAAVVWLKKPTAPPELLVVAVATPVPAMLAPPVGLPVALNVPRVKAMAAPAPTPAPVVAMPEPTAVVAAPEPAPTRVSDFRPAVRPLATSEATEMTRSAQLKEAPAPMRAAALAVPISGGRVMNDAQRSETQYRQALAALDEGRVAGAMDMLTQTLKLNPRHDAARQSLAALLIEAGRNDEAMQQLEQGLALDAGQPAMAMLLARMQIERGASGVATLLRTLPAAGGNADYHAFLAGALQREARHKDAAAQYAAALRSAPDNSVWLMGLGISLQAEKRNAEALEAFQRARAVGTLSAPLLQFVDRAIAQLTP